MNMIRFILFLSIFYSFLYSADIRVGYDTSVFQNTSKKDVALSTDLWFQTIIDKKKYSTSFKIYDTPQTLAKDFKDNKVNLIVTKGDNLIKYYDQQDVIPSFTASYIDEKDQYYVVVVDKKHKENWQKKNHPKIGILQESNLQKIFFEYNFLKENKNNTLHIEEFATSSRMILKIFFGKLDCALVPYRSYRTVIELNPQIKEKVVIAQTTKLTSLVFAIYRKGTDETMLQEVNQGIVDFIQSDKMREVLRVNKMEFLKKTDLTQLDAIKELLDNHNQLMKKSLEVKQK